MRMPVASTAAAGIDDEVDVVDRDRAEQFADRLGHAEEALGLDLAVAGRPVEQAVLAGDRQQHPDALLVRPS